MQVHQHGGNIFRVARELGLPVAEILDFSASINPLGMPPEVMRAARESLAESVHYPEADAGSLAEALARYHRMPRGHFLPGCGSTELLYLLPRVLAPRRALVVIPAFGEYERSLRQAGARIDFFPLSPGDKFSFDPELLLRSLKPDTDLVVVANPGNPTGAVIHPDALESIVAALDGRAVIAVDEAFVDFSPQASVLAHIQAHSNLYVFRSLTKFYAIPGLRAGYLAGPLRGIDRLAAAAPPWSLSVPALAAAKACLLAAEFRQQTLEIIPQWRRQLSDGLTALGLEVFPSQGNFLLARLVGKRQHAAGLAEALQKKGILIRDCGNFSGLTGQFLRVAVRTAEENRRLLKSLGAVLAAGSAEGPGG